MELQGITGYNDDPSELSKVAEIWQISKIESMLVQSAWNTDIDIDTLTYNEANMLIQKLKENQFCRIDGGFNYSKTDIINKINVICFGIYV
jgi:hypothetical protein